MAIASRRTGKYWLQPISFKNIVSGTKLLVKSIEQIKMNKGMSFDGYSFVDPMEKMCGHTVTVDSVMNRYNRKLYPSDFEDPSNQPERPYILVIDDEDGNPSEWFWTPGMFERMLEP